MRVEPRDFLPVVKACDLGTPFLFKRIVPQNSKSFSTNHFAIGNEEYQLSINKHMPLNQNLALSNNLFIGYAVAVSSPLASSLPWYIKNRMQ